MTQIPVGARHELLVSVTSENAISFLANDEARVLSTPSLIAYMEWAARDAVKPYLLDGQDTVGTHVNIRHLAAIPIGCQARFQAEVIEITDRRVSFRVDAWDEQEKIGEGTHERAIIDIARFAQRLRSKRAV